MDTSSFLLIIVTISLFISLFLAVFLFIAKSENKQSNRLFSFFLILIAIDVSGFLYNSTDGSMSNLAMLRNLAVFLQLPVLFLYVLSASYSNFKLKPIHLLHSISFIIVNLIYLPRFYLKNSIEKIEFLKNFKNLFEVQFNHAFLHLQVIAYLILIFITLQKAKKLYLENYAGENLKSYRWLFQLSVAVALLYGIAFLKNIFKFSSEYEDISYLIRASLYVFNLLIVCWYLFKALNNPDLFRSVDSKLKLVDSIISEEKKTSNSLLVGTNFNDELKILKDYMENEKPFLNPSLTVKDLSKEIKIPARELSVLINHQLGQHFFDFVNSYRIKNAMQLLTDPNSKKVTVLEILYEVGFNSKSSFNTAFKKHTGFTPTTYRKTHS